MENNSIYFNFLYLPLICFFINFPITNPSNCSKVYNIAQFVWNSSKENNINTTKKITLYIKEKIILFICIVFFKEYNNDSIISPPNIIIIYVANPIIDNPKSKIFSLNQNTLNKKIAINITIPFSTMNLLFLLLISL